MKYSFQLNQDNSEHTSYTGTRYVSLLHGKCKKELPREDSLPTYHERYKEKIESLEDEGKRNETHSYKKTIILICIVCTVVAIIIPISIAYGKNGK